ncbi:MAG TPA: hypothetical protein VMY80_07830, partial [Anaerolineae bacterium]|nr:hypothetical protein [Anaerolineae bacterium]
GRYTGTLPLTVVPPTGIYDVQFIPPPGLGLGAVTILDVTSADAGCAEVSQVNRGTLHSTGAFVRPPCLDIEVLYQGHPCEQGLAFVRAGEELAMRLKGLKILFLLSRLMNLLYSTSRSVKKWVGRKWVPTV